MEIQDLKEATAVASFFISSTDNFLFKALTDNLPFPAIWRNTAY